jgi:N-acetylneuraminic acid mutarotase
MKKHILLYALLLSFNFLLAQAWETVAPLPGGSSDARHHPVTFSVDGYGYLLTGSVNGAPGRDFMRYEAATDTWETLPDFPGPARSFAYGTARGTKAYVGFGGFNGISLNDLWEYDTETEEWTELADCPCATRFHPAFVQLDDKIYVGMGNNQANLKDWWEYDITTDTWTRKDDLPGPSRHHPFYFGIGDIAYVGFGHGNSIGGNVQIYNDFYQFDPATDEWTQLNDFPGEARVAGTQFDYKGKGYVLSGDGDNHNYMEEGEFWEYDPLVDEWEQLPPHPGNSRWAPGNFVIDNYVYFMCGLSTVRLENDMMRYELEPLTTSTGDGFAAAPIAVFPNPATSVISFTEDIAQFSEVRLVDGFGKVIQRVNSNQIDVEVLPAGMYYLQFFKNERTRIEKFMVAR